MEDLLVPKLVITLCMVAKAHIGRVVYVELDLSVVLSWKRQDIRIKN